MTKEQANQQLQDVFNVSTRADVLDLAGVVKFLFDNLDGRGHLDNVAWGSDEAKNNYQKLNKPWTTLP
jgi:hypothetical protein